MNNPDTGIPTLPEWKELYEQALQFKGIAPWDWMDDSDLFGVKDPVSGETGYCCILGAGGQVFGLAVYKGTDGLDGYGIARNLPESQYDEDMIHLKKCLLLTFEDRSCLEKQDLQVIKNLGLHFQGANAWPFFRTYDPGYFPWHFNAEQVRFMSICLQQVNETVTRFGKDRSLFNPPQPGVHFVRVRENLMTGGAWKDAWLKPVRLEKRYMIKQEMDGGRLQKIIKNSRRQKAVWEADFFYAPMVVGGKGERPYFPVTLLLVDHDSYFVFTGHFSAHNQYLPEFCEEFLKVMEKEKIIPAEVRVCKEELKWMLDPLAQALGVQISLARKLPVADKVGEDMRRFFRERQER